MLNVQMNSVRDECIKLFKIDSEKSKQDSTQKVTLYPITPKIINVIYYRILKNDLFNL